MTNTVGKKGERPGHYKIHDYVIGKSNQGALPEEVPAEIAELCDEILNIPDKGDNILKQPHIFIVNLKIFMHLPMEMEE